MSLYKYLQEPFGPYPENIILSPHCKKRLSLKSLRMECGASPIGFVSSDSSCSIKTAVEIFMNSLDETEFIAAAPKYSRIVRSITKFYGIIELDSLEWLSPRGEEYLQQELHRRLVDLDRDRHSKGFTLNDLYRVSGIRMWIQCNKRMHARFLTSNGFETSLVINSDNRLYNVLSLDAATFRLSRNFLTRWRLWVLIEKLIEDDHMQTPIEERTIDWLVDQYLVRLHKHSFGRFPRHVCRAEVIGIFAAHADWILAQHLATTAKIVQKLNVQKWISFCMEVQSARSSASQEPITLGWGLPENGTIEEDILNLSRFGTIGGGWDKKITSALKKRPKKTQSEKPRVSSPKTVNRHPSTTSRYKSTTQFVYDSDFSEVSTSSYSESSDEELTKDLLKTAGIYSRRPSLRSGYFEWRCPVCEYSIDLLDLKEGDTKALSATDNQKLRGGKWKFLKDEQVQTIFFDIVKDHLAVHARLVA